MSNSDFDIVPVNEADMAKLQENMMDVIFTRTTGHVVPSKPLPEQTRRMEAFCQMLKMLETIQFDPMPESMTALAQDITSSPAPTSAETLKEGESMQIGPVKVTAFAKKSHTKPAEKYLKLSMSGSACLLKLER